MTYMSPIVIPYIKRLSNLLGTDDSPSERGHGYIISKGGRGAPLWLASQAVTVPRLWELHIQVSLHMYVGT